MTHRYVCIHGHFYQPPRENPWLESIEVQDSAYPYHDWNERVTAESYAPNARSRILDAEGRIERLVNNYGRLSFNFGPTLLSWMEVHAADVYAAILEADQRSRKRFNGHGSALAQAYNHLIMPLANDRDLRTQVLWGVKDFEHRFGRAPEGMWLPETAVDNRTLVALADAGVKFTVLAPHQARQVRPLEGGEWTEVSGGRIDGRVPYRAQLPGGRTIDLFFYDGPASRAVAFERLLEDGNGFADRLTGLLPATSDRPLLAHIATDGETYGHHHRHGDMALAVALVRLEQSPAPTLTNYGQFLELCPPTQEVEILENTSWSCAHGVERWRSDCGCNGGKPWHQKWRAPLREALDWLRDQLAPRYEAAAKDLFADPWRARDDYIEVILDRGRENVDQFLRRHAGRELGDAERVRALKLLELQRQTMLMYTSCGWFFDDISGIETVQVIRYAARAIQLGQELFNEPYEAPFLSRLEHAPSNVEKMGNGRRIYEQHVRPSIIDLPWVAAHYAFTSLFEAYPERTPVHAFLVDREDARVFTAGRARLGLGRVRVTSRVTQEAATLSYAVLHLGDHNMHGGVRPFTDDEKYAAWTRELTESFEHARLTDAIGLINQLFKGRTFSLQQLFRDEQRRIVEQVLESAFHDVETSFRRLYDRYLPLLRFLANLGQPLPRQFRVVGEFVINQTLQRAFQNERLDVPGIQALLEEAQRDALVLDTGGLAYAFQKQIESLFRALAASPREVRRLEPVAAATRLARSVPFDVDLWRAQNEFYALLESVFPDQRERAAAGDEVAARWLARFRETGEALRVQVPP